MTIAFDNSYARLPERFFVRQPPVAVAEPGLVAVNRGLAERLGLELRRTAVVGDDPTVMGALARRCATHLEAP